MSATPTELDDYFPTESEEDQERSQDEEEFGLQMRLLEYEAEVRMLRTQLESQRALMQSLQASLLDGGGHVLSDDGDRGTPLPPLSEACKLGDVAVIAALLTDSPSRWGDLNAALQVACQHGRAGAAEMLIGVGADVHADHGSALLWACHTGGSEIAAMLLERGARTDVINGLPMRLAVRGGHAGVVELLVGAERTLTP